MMNAEKNEIRIRISGLSTGIHEYHFSVEPADLSLSGGFDAPVKVDISLDKGTRQIYLRAEISTAGEFTCDRCLELFRKQVATKISIVFVFSELDSAGIPADEVRIIPPEAMYVDVTDDVRQSIALAVPLKLLCRDECKGLCPHCGTNWNTASCECTDENEIDPRWERLKNIL